MSSSASKLMWFAVYWLAGVAIVGSIAYLIKLVLV
ncbi:MAG: DUF2474 domain-containing protein [Pseudomonadota bacterium]